MYLHLTPIKNIDSIRKQGLLPSIPYLNHHKKTWKKEYGLDKIIYSTVDEGRHGEKYIKDFVYWNEINKPRSLKMQEIEEDRSSSEYFKFYNTWMEFYINPTKKFDVLPNFIPKDIKYIILGIDYKNVTPFAYITHVQSSDNTCGGYGHVQDEFSHENKRMAMLDKIVEPKYLKILGEVSLRVGRRNKLNITVNWD